MTEFMKTYKLKITVFSPVHIGASADLEPTEYVICSEGQVAAAPQKTKETVIICPVCYHKNPIDAWYCGNCGEDLPKQTAPIRQAEQPKATGSFLYTFTPGQLKEALAVSSWKSFCDIVRKNDANSLRELLNFFRNNKRDIAAKGTKRAKVCAEFVNDYGSFRNSGNNDRDINGLAVEALISDPVTGRPYIPGTEIKGAIRTALMSAKNKTIQLNRQRFIYHNYRKNRNEAKKEAGSVAEQKLYKYQSVDADPFKALKISDAMLAAEPFCSEIAFSERKLPERVIKNYVEIIPEGTSFVFDLSVWEDWVWEGCNFDETIETIRDACNKFYIDLLEEENSRKWDGNMDRGILEPLREKAKVSGCFILNLGKHGGAEGKTIDGLRIIENRQTHQLNDHAETFCKANGVKPFGWCVVEFEEAK